MELREFGRTEDGVVHEVRLVSPAGATASIVTLGGCLRDLVVPLRDGTKRRVVLGYEGLDGYRANPSYLGALVGRCANRIGGARFRLGGRDHVLPANEGANMLHGGPGGFSHRIWRVEDLAPSAVRLSLVSADGDQGFPGEVTVQCTYALTEEATLSITLTATTTAATVVNLTNHAYFTLNDGGDCRDHLLRLHADFHTPVDAGLIPTGAVLPVAGTAFDFLTARPIGGDFDTPFVLAGVPGEVVPAAEVTAPDGRLRLEVETDQPCLQLYTGQHLGETAPPLGGLQHRSHAGFCLEAQGLVDAPNVRHFPSVVLQPGDLYRQTSLYRFRAL